MERNINWEPLGLQALVRFGIGCLWLDLKWKIASKITSFFQEKDRNRLDWGKDWGSMIKEVLVAWENTEKRHPRVPRSRFVLTTEEVCSRRSNVHVLAMNLNLIRWVKCYHLFNLTNFDWFITSFYSSFPKFGLHLAFLLVIRSSIFPFGIIIYCCVPLIII